MFFLLGSSLAIVSGFLPVPMMELCECGTPKVGFVT